VAFSHCFAIAPQKQQQHFVSQQHGAMESSFILAIMPFMVWMLVKALFLQEMPTIGSTNLQQAVLNSQFFFLPLMAALVYVSGVYRPSQRRCGASQPGACSRGILLSIRLTQQYCCCRLLLCTRISCFCFERYTDSSAMLSMLSL
jgi:hypothetical protein